MTHDQLHASYMARLKSNPWAQSLKSRSHKYPVMTPTFCRTKRKPVEECQCLRCKPTKERESMSEEIEVVAMYLDGRLLKGLAFDAEGMGDLMTVAQCKRIVEQYKRDAARMREALELWLADYDEVALNPDFEPYPHVAVRVEKTRSALSTQPDHIGEANKMASNWQPIETAPKDVTIVRLLAEKNAELEAAKAELERRALAEPLLATALGAALGYVAESYGDEGGRAAVLELLECALKEIENAAGKPR